MTTKKQKQSLRVQSLLDEICEVTPICEDYPKLNGTGIEFFSFKFKDGTTMIPYGLTLEIISQFPKKDQSKYVDNIGGKTAFTYRVVNGESYSPILFSEFSKKLSDELNISGYKLFDYVSDWVDTIYGYWKIKR